MFDRNQMSALCYNNGFTLWHYRTPDDFNDVIDPGYFNEWSEYLRPGDMIILNSEMVILNILNTNTHDVKHNSYLFVKSIQGGVVDVE